MEPISSLIAGYATGKLTEIAESMVRTHVIERWGRFRAKQFFDAFCGAIASEGTTELELQQLLDDLLSDDRRSQVLFDAYRSVCFTKSRSLGPRIIALLTAELVTRESVADDEEDAIFSAAEELSDAELAEFSAFALDHANRRNIDTDDTSTRHGSLSINMGEELIDSTWRRETDISLGPLNLATDIGSWALKLKRHGLISDDVREQQWDYQEDSERHIDEPGTMRQVTWWLYLHPSALRLAELTKQAS
ncbi:hypothetical protein [Candidatus Electronema sp. PJ]|uniref:hypothetical protein n=1 Tax=Candidatus Electronema sp. PJ TaxID=3401572 RepID=UPI003AA87721